MADRNNADFYVAFMLGALLPRSPRLPRNFVRVPRGRADRKR